MTATLDAQLTPVLSTATLKRSPSGSSLTYTRKKGLVKFSLGGTLSDPFGRVGGAQVWLQKSSNGKKWANLYRCTSNVNGNFSYAFNAKKKATMYYRWVFSAKEFDRGVTTSKQKVRVK